MSKHLSGARRNSRRSSSSSSAFLTLHMPINGFPSARTRAKHSASAGCGASSVMRNSTKSHSWPHRRPIARLPVPQTRKFRDVRNLQSPPAVTPYVASGPLSALTDRCAVPVGKDLHERRLPGNGTAEKRYGEVIHAATRLHQPFTGFFLPSIEVTTELLEVFEYFVLQESDFPGILQQVNGHPIESFFGRAETLLCDSSIHLVPLGGTLGELIPSQRHRSSRRGSWRFLPRVPPLVHRRQSLGVCPAVLVL